MTRFFKPASFRLLVLIAGLLAAAQAASATTIVPMSDKEMIIGARVVVTGKVLAIESSFDERQDRIYTYITVKVQQVLKGQLSERRIVLKELGGQVGDRGLMVWGNPQFKRDERVLLYLDTWKDGSLRTYQMVLGKFSIVQDGTSGRDYVQRGESDEGTSHPRLQSLADQPASKITDRMELNSYLALVRELLTANREQSQQFQQTYYGNVPLNAQPAEYKKIAGHGDVHAEWTYISSAHPRWFEPDNSQPVVFQVNPDQAPNPQIVDDVTAAMNCWGAVPGTSLRVATGSNTDACREGAGLNLILFNSCDGRWAPSSGCSGVLALGGLGWNGNSTVIGGVTYRQAQAGFISFNPYASCYFGDHCNVREITTHELGHALGLGHSADSNATMYAFAHFDGRCASVMPDDKAGIVTIYPGTGGGGALSVTTTSLPGGVVNTAYTAVLQATGGTLPYTWSLTAGGLPAGLSLNATTGAITGLPTTTTTANFTVQVRDSASPQATATQQLSITITAAGAANYDSQFVSQTVPTTLTPGQTFSVTMKFMNTGSRNWNEADMYYLASQNPPLNQTWGGNGLLLDTFLPTGPGQQLTINFQAVAPSTPGTYNFQWQLYRNDGSTGFFGAVAPNVVVQVGGGTDDADFVSQNVPTTMTAGHSTQVSLTFNNSGSTTWAQGTYVLKSMNPTGNTTWGLSQVALPASVAPGNNITFTFNVTPPATPGDYNFQWSLAAGGVAFGTSSTNLAITVVGTHKAPGDMDGDGKTDISFYRDGMWGFLKSSLNYNTGSAQFFSWGGAGMPPIIADFDGDGKADIGYIVPPSGGQSATYSILLSSRNYSFAAGQPLFVPAGFPSVGDTPVVGDFDGDGKADPAIWRSSVGVWIIPKSSANYAQFIFTQWGQSGDVPVVADVDGDGKADIGFYRDGMWGFLKSSQNYSTASPLFFSWGGSGLQPICADFDGDGKADIGYIVPPSGGQSATYSILLSSRNYSFAAGQPLFVPAGFPSVGDTPVVGDFDGDGKADPAIWRSSVGVWIIPKSSANYAQFIFTQWGQSGDVPIPNSLTQR